MLNSILGEENAEFETMILPERGDISFRFKIKDTEENRENLKKALSRFYEPAADDFDELKINGENISKDFIGLEITEPFLFEKSFLYLKLGTGRIETKSFTNTISFRSQKRKLKHFFRIFMRDAP